MAEIELDIDRESEFTLIKVVGWLESGELKKIMVDYYAQEPTRLIMLDFTEGHWPRTSMDAYIRESQNAEQYSRSRGKTALVFSDQSDFGIGRLLETYFGLSTSQTELNCFMDVAEAREWLFNED